MVHRVLPVRSIFFSYETIFGLIHLTEFCQEIPGPDSLNDFDMCKIYSVSDGVYQSEGHLLTFPDILSGMSQSPNGEL